MRGARTRAARPLSGPDQDREAIIDKARWQALSPLLDELLDATSSEREMRLAQLRAEDHVRAADLAALLAIKAQVDTEHFLEDSAVDRVAAVSPLPGKVVGNYTLVRELGAGGMGTVWLARRSDGRFEGQAAVKLLNLGLLGRAGIERFRREGNALARLAHPNIAHLIDAGAVDGQPFLVLEYVEGASLDAWCDTHALGVEARIRLFLQVLAAVSYAHSRLILHRDLKPSNILVSAQGQVKLLDFGIARLLGDASPAAEGSELTQLGGRALTPDYAAPEQIQGTEVSTATDVYALGVLLFQLLAAGHPTARAGMGHVERLRAVVEAEPQRLSAAALAAPESTAQARGTTPAGLARALRGDLDNIVARALKKSPAERYATAEAFATDLQRFLAFQPVAARPDSATYRLAKFIRRNRMTLGAAGLVVLAIAAGVIGVAWQAAEANRRGIEAAQQRDRAQVLLGRHGAVVDFVRRMFTETPAPGEAVVIQATLERGEAIVAREKELPAAERAEMLLVLASYYNGLDNHQRAADLLQQARALVEAGNDIPLKARLACLHASNLYQLNLRTQATQLLDQWTDAPGIDDESAASCLSIRASIALNANQPRESLHYANLALARVRAAPVQDTLSEVNLLGDIGSALSLAGRNDEAAQHYTTALARIRALGRGDGHTARRMLGNWGVASYRTGNFSQGLAIFEQLMRMEEVLYADKMAAAPTLANHAFGLEQLGRYDAALAQYALAARAAERSGELAGSAYALVGQASVLLQLGRRAEAERALDQAAGLTRQGLPETHPVTVRTRLVRGQIALEAGALDVAAEQFTAVIETLGASGVVHGVMSAAYRQRAEVALRQGDPARARADAQQALELGRRLQGKEASSAYTGLAALTLGRTERAAGREDEARAAFRAAEENLLGALGPEHPATTLARNLAGERK